MMQSVFGQGHRMNHREYRREVILTWQTEVMLMLIMLLMNCNKREFCSVRIDFNTEAEPNHILQPFNKCTFFFFTMLYMSILNSTEVLITSDLNKSCCVTDIRRCSTDLVTFLDVMYSWGSLLHPTFRVLLYLVVASGINQV